MKIKFTYSLPYDITYSDTQQLPQWTLTRAKIEEIEQFWIARGAEIEDVLKEITGLSFTESEVRCYPNNNASLSDPFSLKIEDIENMRDNLIHELIHVLLTQNNSSKTTQWQKIDEDFPAELHTTRTHIIVHAIHLIACKKLMPERAVSIMSYSKYPAYVRSWEIVKEIGAQNIVDIYIRA